MHESVLRSEVFGIVREVLGKPDLELSDGTTASEVEGWDSLRQVLVIVAIEERFGLRLSSKEIDSLNCLGDLSVILERAVGTQQ